MPISAALGWKCTKCTYQHRVPGDRCVMCNELRVTREHMRDFVLGKPIPDECKIGYIHIEEKDKPLSSLPNQGDHENRSSCSAPTAAIANGSAKQKQNRETPSFSVLNNPYAKRQKTQSQQQQQQTRHPVVSKVPTTTVTSATSNPIASSSTCSNTSCSNINRCAFHPTATNTNDSDQQMRDRHLSVQQAAQTPNLGSTNVAPIISTTTTTTRPSASGSNYSCTLPSRNSVSSTATILSHNTTNQQLPRKHPNPPQQQQQQKMKRPAPPFARAVCPVFHPGPVPFDPNTAHEWIYPVSETYAKRQYQVEISQTAVMHNTLVSLPTGLGKTLIAAVVMYNYYRWFPTGKIIFLAPTQPLVKQQVGACHDIMGFLPTDTAVLTGNTVADKRRDIWQSSRRVFYCTPQTVQRDLYAHRLDARQVVCLVLDEAHKATGDYAYVKIVEHLMQLGAKFRLLALSATPGTSLAAIQQVVNALHINRIEARTDDDPTVAPYIHRRDTEYIVVPQTSMVKNVEYALNDIISPLLNKLRSSSGMLRSAGYATVTTYTLIQAMQECKKRHGGHSSSGHDTNNNMIGYIMAAQQFVQMRTDLQKHGLGMVQIKLQRLRQERNRGPLASIVRGQEFATLWERVQEATGGEPSSPESSQNVQQDKLAHNPKLAALVQVLLEHFERHRDRDNNTQSSTRVIVFSQWRDSVSEIVSVLETYQPSVRPRWFVGQNAGGGGGVGTNKTNNDRSKLKGMKQTEQQEVIRQFREGVYNVLVCTSIGEEGLDIGQVDLICCFDVLRSPIRSLQRIGRTGRKRAGKVVVFVSEGQEEITLKSSKQSERNLAHALRNPKSFIVTPTVPMFPSTPALSEQKMTIGQAFRMSQVEGIDVSEKRTDRSSLGDKSPCDRGSWQLTVAQEKLRLLVLCGERGSIPDECHGHNGLSSALLRRFRQGRSLSRCLQKDLPLGRSAQLLRHIEKSHRDKETSRRNEPSRMDYLRVGRCVDSNMGVFPLMPLDANELPVDFSCLEQPPVCEPANDENDLPTKELCAAPIHSQSTCHHGTHNKENEPHNSIKLPSDDPMNDAFKDSNMSSETRSNSHDGPVETAASSRDHFPAAASDRPQLLSVVNPYVAPKAAGNNGNLDGQAEKPNAASAGRLDAVASCPSFVLQDGIDAASCVFPDHSSPHQQNPSPVDQDKIEEMVLDDFVLHSQEDSDSDVEKSRIVDSKRSDADLPVRNEPIGDVSEETTIGRSLDTVLDSMRNDGTACETKDRITSDDKGGFLPPWESDPSEKSSTLSTRFGDTPKKEEKASKNGNCEQADEFALPSQGSNSHANLTVDAVLVKAAMVRNDKTLAGAIGDDFVLPSQDASSSEESESEEEIICRGSRKDLSISRAEKLAPFQNSGDDLCDTQSCQPSQPCPKQTPPPSGGDDLCDTQSCQPSQQSSHNGLVLRSTESLTSGRMGSSSSRLAPAKKRRRLAIQRFFEEEAGIDSNDDMDGDESESSEIRRIEDEEQDIDGFINDSDQLGYSHDALDEVDPEATHKVLDMERAKKQQFATPVLNRRMVGAKNRDSWIEKAPDSANGLGNMHFIRSVIEHHKKGGVAEDIERFYHDLEEEEGSIDEEALVPQRQAPARQTVYYEPSDDSDEE